MTITPIALSVITWKFAYQLAYYFLPTIDEEEPETVRPYKDIETTAMTIIGIFVLAYAIPDAIYWFTFKIQTSNLNIDFNLNDPQFLAPIVATAIEFMGHD